MPQTLNEVGGFLTVRGAAEYLGLEEHTIRAYIRNETLPAYRLGPRHIRIKRDDLDALVQPIRAVS